MKTPLDNLKDILSRADALAEAALPAKQNSETAAPVGDFYNEPEIKKPARVEEPIEIQGKGADYSENVKKLDELLKAYRFKKGNLSSMTK